MLMADGVYSAVTKGLSPYYRTNGRLSVAIKCVTEENKEIVARVHVELNDETISESALQRLHEIFPEWDRTIDGLFLESNFVDVPCSITVENRQGEGEYEGKTFTDVKWINPPGGGGVQMPQTAAKTDLAAKYGSKFRALAGPQAAKKATPPAAKKTAPPKAPPKAAAKAVTMEDAWEVCLKGCGDKAEDCWNKAIAECAGGKDYENITADEWKAVMEKVALPF